MAKLPIPFGNPYTYPGHSGIDFPQKRGTPFRASGPGRVTTRSKNLRGGYYVWVQYDAGPLVGYHHMDSHNGVPAVGTRVSEGALLGYVGSLGQYSTGPHLHSEVSGHRTTDGYWEFFDRNRVVGQATPASNPAPAGDGDEFMAKIDDLWQRWQPGEAGVKTAGDLYLLFAEVVTKVRTLAADTAKAVWSTQVSRGGGKVSALQELADAKTYGITANEKLDELLKRPSVTLTDAQADQLADKVGQKVALSIAPAVLDAMAKRLES